MGDFMDLDTCTLREVEVASNQSEPEEINTGGSSRQLKPILDWDSIRWLNIHGPRSLMIVWKQLVATSSRLRQESQDFLRW